jgi:hypothetical protein
MAFATAGSTFTSFVDPTNRSATSSTLFATTNHAQLFEFVSEGVGLDQQIVDASGVRGTQSHKDTRTRFGPRVVGGTITMQPSALDLRNLSPILIGGTIASPAFSETGPTAFDLAISREAKDFYYNTGKCLGFSLGSTTNGILTLSMGCVFTDEVVHPAATLSGEALTASDSQSPLMHFDTSGAVLMDSSGTPLTVTPEAIGFSVSHGVMTDRFRNSNTITAAPAMDRTVSLSLMMPYNAGVAAATTLYPIPYAGYGAGRISITYTNGDQSGVSAAFVFRVVKFNRRTPVVNGRGEVSIPFVGRAFWDGTGRELVATIDGVV